MPTSKPLLPSMWRVPQVFRDRMGDKVGRQRAMHAEDHLLLVLHKPPGAEETERMPRFIWRQPDGSWVASELGGGGASLGRHIKDYEDQLDVIEDQEEKVTGSVQYFDLLERLAPLLRASRNMHQVLQEARKLIPDDRNIINSRDRAYDLERTAELLYDNCKNALDYAIAKRTEEQAAASHEMATGSHRLNLLASFFFPIATLSAVFGVNMKHGFEESPAPGSFLVMIGFGLTGGALLTAAVMRRPKSGR